MKAIRFDHHGEPVKVLAIEERPVPEPVDGEVRVRILASPVNPSDLLYVRGHYAGIEAQLPEPVGFEGVGIVDALGPQVLGCVPGQRVAVLNSRGATGPNMLWCARARRYCFRCLRRSKMRK